MTARVLEAAVEDAAWRWFIGADGPGELSSNSEASVWLSARNTGNIDLLDFSGTRRCSQIALIGLASCPVY